MLQDARLRAADEAFSNYVFEGLTVLETGGWETKLPGSQLTRVVFFEQPTDARAPSVKGHFTAHFHGTQSSVVNNVSVDRDAIEIGPTLDPH